jgi:hypothetical protein
VRTARRQTETVLRATARETKETPSTREVYPPAALREDLGVAGRNRGKKNVAKLSFAISALHFRTPKNFSCYRFQNPGNPRL